MSDTHSNPALSASQRKALAKLRADYLKKQTDGIIAAVTAPEFVSRVDAVLVAPRNEQLDLAAETLTPSALKKAGVKLPAGVRVSSRYFEEGSTKATELGAPGATLSAGKGIPGIPTLPGRPPIQGLPKMPGGRTVPGIPPVASWSVCVCVGAGGCVGVGGGS